MGINFRQILFQKKEPELHNVLWLNMIDKKPVLKVFNNGEWQVIAGGSSGNIQSDWSVDDPKKEGYIKHKPDLSIYVEKEKGKGLSSNDFTQEYIDKIEYPETVGDFPKSTEVVDIVNSENENVYTRSKDLLPIFQTKQDKVIVQGLECSAVCAHTFFIGWSNGNSGIGVAYTNEYIPLFYVKSVNLGKAQLAFTLYSRDSVEDVYKSSYFFSSRNGRNPEMLVTDFSASGTQYLNTNSVGYVRLSTNEFLIVRKIINDKNSKGKSGEDPFVCVVNAIDAYNMGYADIVCFTTANTEKEHPDSPESKILINESYSTYNNVILNDNFISATFDSTIETLIGDINTIIENIIG